MRTQRYGIVLIMLLLATMASLTSPRSAAAGDNNILWDYLYHSAAGTNPQAETVPGQSFTFMRREADNSIVISLLTGWMDLTSANIRYWNGAERWVPLSWVKNVTASVRGQPSRTYDLWQGRVPAHAAGTTIWYRLQVVDGSRVAWLKASGGSYVNPLGQHVRGDSVDAGDYGYTFPSSAASPTATRTSTRTATLGAASPTATRTRTRTATGGAGSPTATRTRTRTSTGVVVSPTPSRTPIGSVCGVGDGAIASAQVYHTDALAEYRTPSGALEQGDAATLTLRVCRGDVQRVQVLVWRTGAPLSAPSATYDASITRSDASYDYWSARVPAPADQVVDQWYQFRVTDGSRVGYYRPASGNTGPGVWSDVLGDPSWRLGTRVGDYAVPGWVQDAVIYQIFPDRFRNGSTANDPHAGTQVYGPATCNGGPCVVQLHGSWNELPTTPTFGVDFFGGDLQGVIEQINAGYFNDLGVNTLYLNPIFRASSNHGYDTNDYYAINPYFGDSATFDQLIAAARAKGLRVVLDAVFNHVGADSRYMDGYGRNRWADTGACEGSDPYRAWFTAGTSGQGTCSGGWGWKGWSGYETIPEVVENDPVKAFFYRGGSAQSPGGTAVSAYWLQKGIAGWRYDVAQDISHAWFQDQRPYLKEGTAPHYGSSEVLLLGEVTGGCNAGLYQSYLNARELDSVMNYCFRDWAVGFANGSAPSGFDSAFNNFRGLIPPSPWKAMMNLISSHDSPRALHLLNGDKARLKLLVLLQMTLPGAPSVYYGDEVGLAGGGDPDNRRTYPWADRGAAPDQAMYAHFKQLIGLRKAHSALRGGDVRTLLVDDASHVYSYTRWDAAGRLVVALNNGTASATARIPVSGLYPEGAQLTDQLSGKTYTVSGGAVSVALSPLWGVILK